MRKGPICNFAVQADKLAIYISYFSNGRYIELEGQIFKVYSALESSQKV